jgi:hypothetical protein
MKGSGSPRRQLGSAQIDTCAPRGQCPTRHSSGCGRGWPGGASEGGERSAEAGGRGRRVRPRGGGHNFPGPGAWDRLRRLDPARVQSGRALNEHVPSGLQLAGESHGEGGDRGRERRRRNRIDPRRQGHGVRLRHHGPLGHRSIGASHATEADQRAPHARRGLLSAGGRARGPGRRGCPRGATRQLRVRAAAYTAYIRQLQRAAMLACSSCARPLGSSRTSIGSRQASTRCRRQATPSPSARRSAHRGGRKTSAYYRSAEAEVSPLPAQQPRVPILVACSGRQMLRLAAREADVIDFALPPDAQEATVAERIGWIRDAAGDRFPRSSSTSI